MLGTGVTVFCVQGLEAVAAVGPSFLHDVALAPQHSLTLKAAEVSHVPVPPLSFRALVCKDDLETGKSLVSVQTHGDNTAEGVTEPQTPKLTSSTACL